MQKLKKQNCCAYCATDAQLRDGPNLCACLCEGTDRSKCPSMSGFNRPPHTFLNRLGLSDTDPNLCATVNASFQAIASNGTGGGGQEESESMPYFPHVPFSSTTNLKLQQYAMGHHAAYNKGLHGSPSPQIGDLGAFFAHPNRGVSGAKADTLVSSSSSSSSKKETMTINGGNRRRRHPGIPFTNLYVEKQMVRNGGGGGGDQASVVAAAFGYTPYASNHYAAEHAYIAPNLQAYREEQEQQNYAQGGNVYHQYLSGAVVGGESFYPGYHNPSVPQQHALHRDMKQASTSHRPVTHAAHYGVY